MAYSWLFKTRCVSYLWAFFCPKQLLSLWTINHNPLSPPEPLSTSPSSDIHKFFHELLHLPFNWLSCSDFIHVKYNYIWICNYSQSICMDQFFFYLLDQNPHSLTHCEWTSPTLHVHLLPVGSLLPHLFSPFLSLPFPPYNPLITGKVLANHWSCHSNSPVQISLCSCT